jgi:hypothetical protein
VRCSCSRKCWEQTSELVGLGAVQDVVRWVRPMEESADGGIASLNWLTENHIADPGSAREKYDERLLDGCDGYCSFGTKRYR